MDEIELATFGQGREIRHTEYLITITDVATEEDPASAGVDVIYGGAGDDWIFAGAGNDILMGGNVLANCKPLLLRSTGKNGQKRKVSLRFIPLPRKQDQQYLTKVITGRRNENPANKSKWRKVA